MTGGLSDLQTARINIIAGLEGLRQYMPAKSWYSLVRILLVWLEAELGRLEHTHDGRKWAA